MDAPKGADLKNLSPSFIQDCDTHFQKTQPMNKLLALLLGSGSLFSKSIVTDAYMDKVAVIESNYDYNAVGDAKKARGAWQMHEASWRESCVWLANSDHSGHDKWMGWSDDWHDGATHPDISKQVAMAYLKNLEHRMQKNFHKVTPVSLYMAYNMGYSGAWHYDFNFRSSMLDSRRRSILMRANYIFSR